MDTIYAYCMPNVFGSADVPVFAMTAEGQLLASDIGSSEDDARKRIEHGFDARSRYAMRYPRGYTIEWVDDPAAHPALKAAVEQHAALSPGQADRR